MRIISGDYRGRLIKAPKGIRPTQTRVRQAIFNSLQGGWREGLKVLDLCCGSGSLGIEALSRGAGSVTFLDRDPIVIDLLLKNLSGFEGRFKILKSDLLRGLSRLAPDRFDLILFDPPYGKGLIPKALKRIVRLGLLTPGGMVVVEHGYREEISPPEGLEKVRERRYGDTVVTYLMAQ